MTNKKLILVVDDDINVQLTLSQILTRAGFQVMSLVNDEESIDKVITDQIDLVIIDFDKEVREDECPLSRIRRKLAIAPLIVLTHDPNEEMVHCSDKFERCTLIIKPIDPDTILETVNGMLSLKAIPMITPN